MSHEVVFATPCFSKHVSYEYAGCLAQTCSLLTSKNVKNRWIVHPGLQFVDVARNILVAQFLQEVPEADCLFFIDDDIGWPPHKVLEFVEHPAPVLAGIYPIKTGPPAEYPVMLHLDKDNQPIENGPYVLARQVCAGFLRIKREVIEQLARKVETYSFAVGTEDEKVVFNLFDCGQERDEATGASKGIFLGEDVYFSRKCIAEGIEIWVDPDVDFSHRGTFKWTGTFRNAYEAYKQGTNEIAKVMDVR